MMASAGLSPLLRGIVAGTVVLVIAGLAMSLMLLLSFSELSFGDVVTGTAADQQSNRSEVELRRIRMAVATSLLLALALSVAAGAAVWRYACSGREALDALMESEQRFRELADLLPAMVVELDRNAVVRFANECAYRMLGYGPGDLEDELQPFDIIAATDLERARSNIDRLLRGEDLGGNEYTLVRKDGSQFPALAQSAPIVRDGKVVGVRSVLVDLSDQKALEGRLRAAEKMEAVGQLAGGVAHDFNNMLAVVIGHTNLLQLKVPPESDVAKSLQMIMDAGNRAAKVAHQLLTYSRQQDMDFRLVNVNELTRKLTGMLERIIGEHISLELDLEPSLPDIKADPSQIEQVLMNLIVNARDAMPDGGTVTIKTALVRAASQPQGEENEPGQVMLSVTDTGHGILENELRRIFEPFYTTKDPQRGTGLGLASVEGIIDKHGGRIEVSSRMETGTRFAVYLPCAAGEKESSGVHPPVRRASFENTTILVVEDDDRLRSVLSEMLKTFGCRALFADRPSQAFHIARTELEHIDIVLADVVLPEMDGNELVRRLVDLGLDAAVIFMSGYSAEILARHGIFAESVLLLRKPFSMDDLRRMLLEAMAGTRHSRALG